MLIYQQQNPSETLQEYVYRFPNLLFKSSGLLPHKQKDLAHITHFIRNLHNQKFQHYVLGKNPTKVQNAITLVQKKDAELKMIEGLHNHNTYHKIHNINLSHNDKLIALDPVTHVMVLTSLKIAMKQLVLDVNPTSMVIPQLNVPPTDPLATRHLTKILLGTHTKLIATQNLAYNFQF